MEHASRLNTTFSPSLPAGGDILVQPSLMGSLFSFFVVPSSFRSLLIGCGRVELKDIQKNLSSRPSVLLVAKAGLGLGRNGHKVSQRRCKVCYLRYMDTRFHYT